MSKWILLLGCLSIAAAALVVLACVRRTKKTMDTIGKMLDAAAKGSYSETLFDESRLSDLESRFSHYLSASTISARNVAAEKDKIKSLIGDISHQTKTPIANLLLYSELLSEDALTEDMRANVEAIQKQAEKLRFLIDALVKLSRLENGILTLSPKRQALAPMLEDVERQYQSAARQKGLDLQVIPSEICAHFDRKWTTEALSNVVDNAIKYTPSGSVTVRACKYELFTRIDVTDTGIGIREEDQPKVFSRFYRSGEVQEKEGVGIGLYLAREIISGEGGYLKVASTPGKGSVFSLFLPCQGVKNV